ncbi:MAG: CHAT domain-containing protein [Calothrix sp. FI2-JRJ7]|jgi:WD40 repeat protein|nr:CHAT domain-containing protein [Calothrix sp. FI2-JRJ7]
MRKLLYLKLDGDLVSGVRVTLTIEEDNHLNHAEITGNLPINLTLSTVFTQWKSEYNNVYASRIIPKGIKLVSNWRQNCNFAANELRNHLNQWLLSEPFRPVRDKCLQQFVIPDEVILLIRTSSQSLLELPWHQWDLIEKNTHVEVALSTPDSEPTQKAKTPTLRSKVKVLAILGDSTGINIEQDRQIITNLPDAEITFLVEPQRQEINDSLWEQPWDILFFAGHSITEGSSGQIYINQTDSLSIERLKYGLRNAVNNGLALAVFNSCDGMGLAFELQKLHIPEIIVMREPVPDKVAQAFITYFLPAFATGKSIYMAEREAREKLFVLEDEFPCASWLPVIFQNPATQPHFWQDLGRRPTNICPYRGLFAFREEDTQLFFGRETFTDELLEAVQNKPLVAVIGSSGSGKSSVIFASLIPHLRQISNSHIISFRPSSEPLHAFANALLSYLEPQMGTSTRRQEIQNLVSDLQHKGNCLQDTLNNISLDDSEKIFIVIDQFEELYTLCQDTQERQIFLDRLLTLISNTNNFTFVITLRADFLGQALSYRPFADVLQHNDLKLSQMNNQELQAVVQKPAALLGVTLESGLTERILGAVGSQAGDLPLLEFALTQLWEKQTDTRLTHAAYDEIGGIEAALARYAEQVYSKLNLEEQEQARRIFVQLVLPGVGTEDARYLAKRAEVGEKNWDLVMHLASSRLIVTGRDDATKKETVEIVHEALIREWERLRQWIKQDREFRIWLSELRATMQQWEKNNQDESELLRGKRLIDAEGWLQRRPNDLNVDEQPYITASLALKEKEFRQKRRLKKLTFASAIGAISILAGALGIGLWQTDIQRRQAQKNEIQAITVSSENLLLANQKLDALISALEVGIRFKQIIETDSFLNKQVVKVLQLAVDSEKELNRLQAHTNWVYDIAFSPDGKMITSAGLDGKIILWNLEDGSYKILNYKDKDKLYSISFCSKGNTFATASADKTVKVWNIDGSLRKSLGHNDSVLKASFSPDCQTLATASGKQVLLWNLNSQTFKTIWTDNDVVNSVSFSTTDKIIGVSTSDNNVKLLDLDGNEIQSFNGHTDKIHHISFSQDGKTIATASWDKTAKLWNLEGKELITFKGHTDRVFDISFNPDNKTIATASWDKTVRLWNIDGTLRTIIKGHNARINSVSFNPKAKVMASAGADNIVKLWKLDNSLLPIQAHTGAVRSVSFSPDGAYMATGSEDATAKLWTTDGRLIKIIDNNTGGVYGVSFSKDGTKIATANVNKTAKIWSSRNLRNITTLQGHKGEVFYARFSPNGKIVATASADKTAKLWNLNGENITTLKGHSDRVVDVSFSPDGTVIATASDDHTAKIWKLDGTLCATLMGHDDEVNGIDFSPQSTQIATASDDKTIGLWNVDTKILCQSNKNKEIHLKDNKRLREHQERVIGVKFNRDGNMIASTSFDNTVRLWNHNGKRTHIFQGHDDWVWSADFSPDGEKLASASNDTTVRFWKLDTETQTLDLNGLLKKGCLQARDYLRNSSNKQLCHKILQY